MALFKKLHQEGITIVLVTHLMDDVAEFADQVYVMEKGKLVKSGNPSLVFKCRIHGRNPIKVFQNHKNLLKG